MISLLDGPAQGHYMARRAPLYLRAVVDEARPGLTGGPKGDVLDQLDDTPTPTEKVYVYQRIGAVQQVHLNFGGRNPATGFYPNAQYTHLPNVDGEALRDNNVWRTWCQGRKDQVD